MTTIVGAKGLSADPVIVLGCDGVNLEWISRSAFFVALTRARESLTLMACIGGGGAKMLHPFVCGLPEDHTKAIQAMADRTKEFHGITTLQEHLGRIYYARTAGSNRH